MEQAEQEAPASRSAAESVEPISVLSPMPMVLHGRSPAPPAPSPPSPPPTGPVNPDPAKTDPAQTPSQDGEPALDLDESEVIVVTGARTERPLAVTTVATEVVTREEIEASGGSNVAEVLASHPGLDIVPVLRGSAVRIQGLNPDYVLVLVDGQRAIGRIDGAVDLERFPIESIERIEIVKGASSALYGSDALAGVINIITRRSQRPVEGQVQARYGSFARSEVNGRVGFRRGEWNGALSGGLGASDGYDLDPDDMSTTASSFDEWRVTGSATGKLGPLEVSLASDYQYTDLRGLDRTGDPASPARVDRLNRVEQASGSARGVWRLAPSRRISANARLAYYRDQFAYDLHDSVDEMSDIYEESTERLVETTAQFDGAIGERHFVTAGIESMFEQFDSPRIRDGETGATELDRYRMSGFGQHEWTVAADPGIIVSPGIRLDHDSQFGFHATPKLALRWDASERVVVRGSYGWGYRAPNFKDLYLCFENPGVGYVISGNPELDPEVSRNSNLGVEVRAHDRVWASANVYYNDVDDLLSIEEIDPSSTGDTACGPAANQRFTYLNVVSAFTRGIETQLRARPRLGPIDGIQVEIGYVLNSTRDREEDRPLSNRALHRGTFKLGYEHPDIGFQAQVRGSVVGARRFYADDDDDGVDDETVTDPYLTVDVRVAQTLMERYTAFVGASNLTDEGDARYLPIPPRTFYGGVTARY